MNLPSPLFEALDEIGKAVASAHRLLVLLDFDGTLAPIAAAPCLAALPGPARQALDLLAARDDCTVGIVSGRAIDDLRTKVGIDGLIYAGNHGLEIAGPKLRFDHPTALALRGCLCEVVATLTDSLQRFAGALVEPKGLTASIHYRLIDPDNHTELEAIVRAVVPENHPELALNRGKMVWEVRPRVRWHKGSAVHWIREQLALQNALTIFLGDDHTDEDAFEAVGRFISARVGPPQSTRAGYQVADPESVAEFLFTLSDSRAVPPSPPPISLR